MSEAYRKQSGKAPKSMKTDKEASAEMNNKLMGKLNKELAEQESKKQVKQPSVKTAEQAGAELQDQLMEKLNKELAEQEKKKSRKQR